MSSVAGGIILLIDAIMAMMLCVLLVVDWISVGLAVFMLVASITAILSSVAVFMSLNPLYIILGPIMLIMGAIFLWALEPGAVAVSIIGSTLAFISIVLLGLGWKDSVARNETRSPPTAASNLHRSSTREGELSGAWAQAQTLIYTSPHLHHGCAHGGEARPA